MLSGKRLSESDAGGQERLQDAHETQNGYSRPRYSLLRVSTLIMSPSLMKIGT